MSAIIEQLQLTGQKLASQKSWLPRLVSLLIVLLFIWWAASKITLLFADDKETNLVKKNTSEQITTAKEQASIDQLNLFGASKQELAEKKAASTKITKLRLTLKGIFATNDPKQGAVQIQNARQQESTFTIGQSIFGKATLDEIYPDRVILYRNGQYETLMLPGKALQAEYFSVAKRSTKPPENKNTLAINKIVTNKPVTNKPIVEKAVSTQAVFTPSTLTPQTVKQQLAEHAVTDKQKSTNDYRTISISGSGKILRDLFIFNTAWKQGNFIGFIIKARDEEGLKMMDVLGIKNHDLITVVNGLRFSEKLESPEQLEKLKTATSIDAIFERNGKEIPFHFDFNTPLSNL